jgi:glycosyltransferase involved in cell wall biosynthesis
MRVLFLTNFYMAGMGGEEQSCQQVVEGLQQRGHTTLVLTSMHGTNNMPVETDGICRSLYLEMDLVPWRHTITFFTKRKAREKHNLHCFERVLEQFNPDIIFIWGMWNLPKSLPAFAEAKYPDQVIYRFASYWPTLPNQHKLYWSAPGRTWYSRLLKRVVGTIALAIVETEEREYHLKFERSICVSTATRDILVEAGVPVSQARIIYTGFNDTFCLNGESPRPEQENQNLNLLYAGRLTPDKGIDTAIKAISKLVCEQGHRGIKMSVAGSGSPEYETYLRDLVARMGLTDTVTFLGWLPPERMPKLLRQFDVLLLPSIWPEPFARTVLEGMVSGLVVVATPTGGTSEIVVDGENGLLFVPGDHEDLAEKVAQLIHNPQLRKKLADTGKQTVMMKFTVTKMMQEIEGYLQEVAIAVQ